MNAEEQKSSLTVISRFYEAEKSYLDAGGGGDFSGIATTLHPECVIYQPASLPCGGKWRGHEGCEDWMKAFVQQWSSMDVKDSTLYTIGDVVVGKSHVHAIDRISGKRLDWPLLQFFRMREGKILELSPFYWDTAALLANLES